MTSFPILSSGAISQYPTECYTGRSVGVIRFVDGSDQRFLRTARPLRRWRIDLTLLNDSEIAALEHFFVVQKGMFSLFTFTDPASQHSIANCRIAESQMMSEYALHNGNSTFLWIIESNG
jgi:hypothetical protein